MEKDSEQGAPSAGEFDRRYADGLDSRLALNQVAVWPEPETPSRITRSRAAQSLAQASAGERQVVTQPKAARKHDRDQAKKKSPATKSHRKSSVKKKRRDPLLSSVSRQQISITHNKDGSIFPPAQNTAETQVFEQSKIEGHRTVTPVRLPDLSSLLLGSTQTFGPKGSDSLRLAPVMPNLTGEKGAVAEANSPSERTFNHGTPVSAAEASERVIERPASQCCEEGNAIQVQPFQFLQGQETQGPHKQDGDRCVAGHQTPDPISREEYCESPNVQDVSSVERDYLEAASVSQEEAVCVSDHNKADQAVTDQPATEHMSQHEGIALFDQRKIDEVQRLFAPFSGKTLIHGSNQQYTNEPVDHQPATAQLTGDEEIRELKRQDAVGPVADVQRWPHSRQEEVVYKSNHSDKGELVADQQTTTSQPRDTHHCPIGLVTYNPVPPPIPQKNLMARDGKHVEEPAADQKLLVTDRSRKEIQRSHPQDNKESDTNLTVQNSQVAHQLHAEDAVAILMRPSHVPGENDSKRQEPKHAGEEYQGSTRQATTEPTSGQPTQVTVSFENNAVVSNKQDVASPATVNRATASTREGHDIKGPINDEAEPLPFEREVLASVPRDLERGNPHIQDQKALVIIEQTRPLVTPEREDLDRNKRGLEARTPDVQPSASVAQTNESGGSNKRKTKPVIASLPPSAALPYTQGAGQSQKLVAGHRTTDRQQSSLDPEKSGSESRSKCEGKQPDVVPQLTLCAAKNSEIVNRNASHPALDKRPQDIIGDTVVPASAPLAKPSKVTMLKADPRPGAVVPPMNATCTPAAAVDTPTALTHLAKSGDSTHVACAEGAVGSDGRTPLPDAHASLPLPSSMSPEIGKPSSHDSSRVGDARSTAAVHATPIGTHSSEATAAGPAQAVTSVAETRVAASGAPSDVPPKAAPASHSHLQRVEVDKEKLVSEVVQKTVATATDLQLQRDSVKTQVHSCTEAVPPTSVSLLQPVDVRKGDCVRPEAVPPTGLIGRNASSKVAGASVSKEPAAAAGTSSNVSEIATPTAAADLQGVVPQKEATTHAEQVPASAPKGSVASPRVAAPSVQGTATTTKPISEAKALPPVAPTQGPANTAYVEELVEHGDANDVIFVAASPSAKTQLTWGCGKNTTSGGGEDYPAPRLSIRPQGGRLRPKSNYRRPAGEKVEDREFEIDNNEVAQTETKSKSARQASTRKRKKPGESGRPRKRTSAKETKRKAKSRATDEHRSDRDDGEEAPLEHSNDVAAEEPTCSATHPSVYKSASRVSGVLLVEIQKACEILFRKYQNVIMEWGIHLGFQDQGARLMIAVDQESLDAIQRIGFVTLGDRSAKYLKEHGDLSRPFPRGGLKDFLLGGIKVDLNDQDVVCLDGRREKDCNGFADLFSEHVAPKCLVDMMNDPDPEIARAASILKHDCSCAEIEVELASESPNKIRCSYAQLSLQSQNFGNHVDQICAGFRTSSNPDAPCRFIGGDGPGRYLFTRTVQGRGQIQLYSSEGRDEGHMWVPSVAPFIVAPGEAYGIWGIAREEWSHEVRLVDENGNDLKTVGRPPKSGVPTMNQTPRVSITYRMYRRGERPIIEHAREMGLANMRLHLSGKIEVAPAGAQACVE